MRRAWLVSMEYDNRNRGHTMCRTKLQATAEACRLADFCRARGFNVTPVKKVESDLFVRERELEGGLFVVAANSDRSGLWGPQNGGFTISISKIEVDEQLWNML